MFFSRLISIPLKPKYFSQPKTKRRKSIHQFLKKSFAAFSAPTTNVYIHTDKVTKQKFILNLDPSTNRLIQKVKCTPVSDLNAIVENLQRDQREYWSSISLLDRVSICRKAFEHAFDQKQDELAILISKEMGKTLQESRDEVSDIIDMKSETLELIRKSNETVNFNSNATTAVRMRDPLGIVAVLSPWNFPAGEPLLHILPALVAGNAVMLKPSELTPLTGSYIVERLLDYSFSYDDKWRKLPINIVQGDKEIGQAIVQHPHIHSICMTGSSAVGKKIIQSSSLKHIKRLILELGGKDPMIVFQDADLEKAAKDAVFGSTYNAGQVCCSIERIYVEKSIKSEFEQLCQQECEKINAGPWSNANACIGPMVSSLQMYRVKKQVEDAVEKGAQILCTGPILEPLNKPQDDESFSSSNGNYYPATLLTNLDNSMKITQKETFGPVIAVYEFDGSEESAIQNANDSEYGLSASVYSSDIVKAARVASQIRAGQVVLNSWVMSGDVSTPLECPWVGHKDSGFGYHSGVEGYNQFSVPKSIIMSDDTSKDTLKEE